jgi:hypothetical protein
VSRSILPATPGAKEIVSGPACAFASRIACRSEPGPEFCVVVTEKPVAPADAIASNTARTVSAAVAPSKGASFFGCARLIGLTLNISVERCKWTRPL